MLYQLFGVRCTTIIFSKCLPYGVFSSADKFLYFVCFQTVLRVSLDSHSFSDQTQWDKECESCGEDREGENTPSRGVKDKRKYGL